MKKLMLICIVIMISLSGLPGRHAPVTALSGGRYDTSTFMGMLAEMDIACPTEAAAVRNFSLSPLFWLVTEYRNNPVDVAGLCVKAAAPQPTTQACLEPYEAREFFAMAFPGNLGVGEDFIWMTPTNAFNYLFEGSTFADKIAFMDQPNPCGTVPPTGTECSTSTLVAPTPLTPANGATTSGDPLFSWDVGPCDPELVLLVKSGPITGTIRYFSPDVTSWTEGPGYLDYCGETYSWWLTAKSVDGAIIQAEPWTYVVSDQDCRPMPSDDEDAAISSPNGLRIVDAREVLSSALVDSDGDGLVDSADDCPNVPGSLLARGCPMRLARCEVQADRRDIVIRVGPGPSRGIFGYLAPQGQWFSVYGYSQADDGSRWWKLNNEQIRGGASANSLWVNQADVPTRGACDFVRETDPSPVLVRQIVPVQSGWGSCGDCSTCGGPTSQCVTSPEGLCLWDTSCAAEPAGEVPGIGVEPPAGACYSVGTSTISVGGGAGSVRIMTPRNCANRTFKAGTVVTFEAVAAQGVFTSWSGCGLSGKSPVVSVAINGNCTATATFTLN